MLARALFLGIAKKNTLDFSKFIRSVVKMSFKNQLCTKKTAKYQSQTQSQ